MNRGRHPASHQKYIVDEIGVSLVALLLPRVIA
jgi:hypothetical protein